MYPGWESAISDAEHKALECEQKAVRFRAVAEVCKKMLESGEPWPTQLTKGQSQQHSVKTLPSGEPWLGDSPTQ